MNERDPGYRVLERCIVDILSVIKPVDDDRNKRLLAIRELENVVHSVAALRGAAVIPFGSFVSNLYSKSGDLDVSVKISTAPNFSISKRKKQNVLRELMNALRRRGVAAVMQFIPHARVPVLQYVSNRFGISCDLSIDNYSGRIKSKIFYWINTLDERFGEMVLLVKEWAKAKNINDPKTGTLNSYSLCLLVLFHFQTCEPAILPPLKDIYEGNISGDSADLMFEDEEHLDEVCRANIEIFRSQNKEPRNESSLCYLLASFFHKFSHIDALPNDVISTYTGQFEQIKYNPKQMTKSYCLFVEDPVERPDNAARAVGMRGLLQIASAFDDAGCKFVSLDGIDRNDLLALMCTPGVGSKLGGRVVANPYTNTPQRSHQHVRSVGRVERVSAKPSDNQHLHRAKGFTGSRPAHNPPHMHTAGRQQNGRTVRTSQNHSHPQVYTAEHQTAGLHQNHNLAQEYYHSGHQTAGQYQNHYHHRPQDFPSGNQTAGPYQNQRRPTIHTNYTASIQTPGQYQNYNHHQTIHTNYTAGLQTPGQYLSLNQANPICIRAIQKGEHISGSENNRKAVTRNGPVLGGFNNVPGWDSRYQF